MDVRNRPEGLGHRKATKKTMRYFAVTLVFSAGLSAVAGLDLFAATRSGDVTSSLAIRPHVDHRVAIGKVGLGQEGLSLSAQLGQDSTRALSAVEWRIRRAGGETVFSGIGAEVTALVQPGEYLVDARYGSSKFEEALNVEPGNHLSVNLILNIGAVRILPTVAGVDDAAVKAVSKIYSLTGLDRGKLVAQSALPGEIIELAAGEYRVESRFESGNALAVSDVVIKPGIMSAVEFHHRAGVARLASAGELLGPVNWTISGTAGDSMFIESLGSHDLVLQPGHYRATAKYRNNEFNTEFDIAAGETQTITLGY